MRDRKSNDAQSEPDPVRAVDGRSRAQVERKGSSQKEGKRRPKHVGREYPLHDSRRTTREFGSARIKKICGSLRFRPVIILSSVAIPPPKERQGHLGLHSDNIGRFTIFCPVLKLRKEFEVIRLYICGQLCNNVVRRQELRCGTDHNLDDIIDLLNEHHKRATYGAIAGILGVPARSLMFGRGRNPENSWVVRGSRGDGVATRRGWPTGYNEDQIHPKCFLQIHERPDNFINDANELCLWLKCKCRLRGHP